MEMKEIRSEVDAVLDVFGTLINKLVEEPQDSWWAGLALDSVCEMHHAILQGMVDLEAIEGLPKKPDHVTLTQWWDERTRVTM
jgi:hypothetical protein